ncbi:hypothetical protein GQ457_05G027870 [Hibiscus cannabinus]
MVMKQLFAAVVVSLVVSAQGSEFPMYKLSLIWPSSACIPRSSCKTPIPTIFTIHGLWPSCKDGTGVPPYNPCANNCNANPTSPGQILDALQPITAELREKWPTLIAGEIDEDFWKTEWSHHGMCSDYSQDPLGYFSETLKLASTYDPLQVLGVEPSNTSYPIDTLLENVKTKVGSYPQISCSLPFRGVKQLYLKEIRFCFKRGNPVSTLQNCPDDMDNVCRSVEPLQRTVMFPPANAIISGFNATGELLAFT